MQFLPKLLRTVDEAVFADRIPVTNTCEARVGNTLARAGQRKPRHNLSARRKKRNRKYSAMLPIDLYSKNQQQEPENLGKSLLVSAALILPF